MLIPFAPILTLCVLLQSLIFQSLNYQVASDAFHLGGYFLLGSNTAYLLTGRMTLLDGLLDVQYIEPPAAPYSKPSLLQTSRVPHPITISSRTWADAIPTSVPSHTLQVSTTTSPTAVDASPALVSHPPDTPLKFDSIQDPGENRSLAELTPPLSGNTSTNVTLVDMFSGESHLGTLNDLAWSLYSSLSLVLLIGRALDSERARIIALAISALIGLLTLAICLHMTRRSLVLQPCPSLVEHAQCGHMEMVQDVRRLLDHIGADNVSLAEFCRSLELLDTAPYHDNISRPVSPSLGVSSSYVAFVQSRVARKRAVRKRIPAVTALPTPEPSGTGQHCSQPGPGPGVLATGDSQLSDLFAFDPPMASSPVRETSQMVSTVPAASSPAKSIPRSRFWLPRSTAPDAIDRMNENRSFLFNDLFKRLDRLGEGSPECSTRLNDINASVAIPVESEDRSQMPQTIDATQEPKPDNFINPLQHKPLLARVTSKLQQWSWVPAWVTCAMVLLMAAGIIPVAPAPPLVLS
ncbi:hypothetical protein BDV93DRAFT_43226 [Ceratobasidium sp. AG-I]|nr:hypothetical protein BDV93DRAFT_43226 [Ceratobasidium sp. AG-I]